MYNVVYLHFTTGVEIYTGMALVVKNPPTSALDVRDMLFDPWIRNIPWRRNGSCLKKFHGQWSLADYSS